MDMQEQENYKDIDGNDITLERLVRTDPEWAVNVIRYLKKRLGSHDEVMAQKFEEKIAQEAGLAAGENKLEGYKLAPCPICGANADMIEDTDFKCHYIGCSNSKCGITLFATKHNTIDEQVAAWNNRDAEGFIKTCFLRGL